MNKSLIVGFLLGLAFMALALRGVDAGKIFETLAHCHWGWLGLAVPLYAAGFLLRSVRWSVLLAPARKFSPWRLFPLVMLGFFINIAGLRLGEVARAFVMGRNLQFPKTTSLASIFVERVFDVLTLILIFALCSSRLPVSALKGSLLAASAAAFLVVIVVLALLAAHPDWFAQQGGRCVPERWRAKFQELVARLSEGAAVLKSPTQVFATAVLSCGVWLAEASVIWAVSCATGLSLSFFGALTTLASLAVGALIPTPGAMGTFEHFGLLALSFLGAAHDQALATLLLLHVYQIAFIAIVGFFCFWREGLEWKTIRQID